jgi:hypothetical protein
MADKFDLSFENCRWFIDLNWHLQIASTDKDHRGQFNDHGYVSELQSESSGGVGDEKDIPLYKIVTVVVTDGAVMEAERITLRAKKIYKRTQAVNQAVVGCIAKGKNLRETAGIYFFIYRIRI